MARGTPRIPAHHEALTASSPAIAQDESETRSAEHADRPADVARIVRRAAMTMALLPFIVAAFVLVFVVRDSYLPISDHALIEMHIRDIGRHAVLDQVRQTTAGQALVGSPDPEHQAGL